MTVQCVTCSRFNLRTSTLAKHGFGHCGDAKPAEHFAAAYERECGLHAPAKIEIVEQRRAWLAKPPKPRQEPEAAPAATPIAEKVAYVKAEGQTRDHHCHWPGCTRQVPPALWGCLPHWQRIPKALRDRIWRTFAPGQEVNATPSREYLDAADAVQKWIRDHEATKATP